MNGRLKQSRAVCVCPCLYACTQAHILPFPLLIHVTDFQYLMCRHYSNDNHDQHHLFIFLPSNITDEVGMTLMTLAPLISGTKNNVH